MLKKALAEPDLFYEPDSSLKTHEECQSGAITTESLFDSIPDAPTNTENTSTQFSMGMPALHRLEIPLIDIRPATPEISKARGYLRDGQDRDICSTIDELRLQSLAIRQNTRLIRLGLNQIGTSLADPGAGAADTKPYNVKELLANAQEEWISLVKETMRVEMLVKTSILSRSISGQIKESQRKWVMNRLSLHQVEMVELQEEFYTLQKGVESIAPGRRFSVPNLGLVTEKVKDLLRRK